MFSPINAILGLLSRDIGIDLGTANTLVLVRGKGVVINEPSVVAINKKNKKVLAIGEEAKRMVGRTPANIIAIRPLKDGVISDFDVTEQMLHYFIAKVHELFAPLIPRPRVVIGIPSGVTEVERRAVHDAACSAGARQALLIEEPMAAAIGAGLPITEPSGSMIVDIGGGTTEVAVISLGGMVTIRSIRIAGDELDQDIILYVRQRHDLLIGERMAEEIKITTASAHAAFDDRSISVRGRDVRTGLPAEITLTSTEVREAVSGSINAIVDAVTETIEETPPELVADMMTRGITLAGGGALLPGLAQLIAEKTGIGVHVAEDPLRAVVHGTGRVLEDPGIFSRVLVDAKESKGPRRR